MDGGIGPVGGGDGVAVFNGVLVNVVDVVLEIGLITNLVFPKPTLPIGVIASGLTRSTAG